MQTQLAPEYAARPDGQEAEAILRKCVHCGYRRGICSAWLCHAIAWHPPTIPHKLWR